MCKPRCSASTWTRIHPIFERFNQYAHHLNRVAALLDRVGENYDHRSWTLKSETAKRDGAYGMSHTNALGLLHIMYRLFRMNSAQRLRSRGDPGYVRWSERLNTDHLQGNDLEIALGAGRRVRTSSRRTFADPLHKLHRSRLYKQLLKIRSGSITLWIWLQQLAQCGDESQRANFIYYFIGSWFRQLIALITPQSHLRNFAPVFEDYLERNASGMRAILRFKDLNIDLLLGGQFYDEIITPALIQCSRTLHGMRQVQKRFRDWFWRPAQEHDQMELLI